MVFFEMASKNKLTMQWMMWYSGIQALGTINFKIPLKTFKKRRNDTHCQQRQLQHNMFSGRT